MTETTKTQTRTTSSRTTSARTTGTAKTATAKTATAKTATAKAATAKTAAPKADTPKVGPATTQTASFDTVADKLAGLARDTAYVLIGAGVLTVQQLQVRRRELAGTVVESPVVKQLSSITLPAELPSQLTNQLTSQLPLKQLEDIVRRLEAGLGQLDERFETIEAKLDAAVAAVEDRLPEQAGQLLGQAHDAAKAARKQVLGLIRNAA